MHFYRLSPVAEVVAEKSEERGEAVYDHVADDVCSKDELDMCCHSSAFVGAPQIVFGLAQHVDHPDLGNNRAQNYECSEQPIQEYSNGLAAVRISFSIH